MKKVLPVLICAIILLLTSSSSANMPMDKPPVYIVKKLKTPLPIDANWNKDSWKKVKEIPVSNFMGEIPAFQPVVRARMMYDQDNLAFHPGEKKRVNVAEDDFRQIEIAHTLPRKLEQEITEPQTWFLEFKLPLGLLRKYSTVTQPEKGGSWKANFYKTSSKSTNPHCLTWAAVDNPVPSFISSHFMEH